jgi:hypothetical protein
MSKQIPVTSFLKELNKKQEGYIEYNKEKSLKVFSNLDFKELNLNNSKNGRVVTITDKDGGHNISSSDFFHTIDGNTSYGSHYLIFRNCKFEKLILGEIPRNIILEDCIIENFEIKNIASREENNLLKLNIKNGFINKLEISNSNISYKLYLNTVEIQEINILNNVFLEDFSIKNSTINDIQIKNTEFNNLSEFHKVSLKNKFLLTEIAYKGLTLFDECKFNDKVTFKYVIFESFSHFRNTTFYGGLNLDYNSNKEVMNFHGVSIEDSKDSKIEITQETYRIIKHNFEKLGNKIEANRYHALELTQKRIELKNDKSSDWKERWVFNLHHWSSVHSTNWFRVILWILFVGILTIGFVNIRLIIELIFNPSLFKVEYIFKAWTELCQFIYIGYMEDKLKEQPLTFLFNKISLGYLYYQFLMSVRKDTRK